MNRFKIVLIVVLTLLSSRAFADGCNPDSIVHNDIITCGVIGVKDADKKLNALYKKAITLSNRSQKTALIASEKLWLKESTAICDNQYADDSASGAREAPIYNLSCLTEAKDRRMEFLSGYVQAIVSR